MYNKMKVVKGVFIQMDLFAHWGSWKMTGCTFVRGGDRGYDNSKSWWANRQDSITLRCGTLLDSKSKFWRSETSECPVGREKIWRGLVSGRSFAARCGCGAEGGYRCCRVLRDSQLNGTTACRPFHFSGRLCLPRFHFVMCCLQHCR